MHKLLRTRQQVLFEVQLQELAAPDQIRFWEADVLVQAVHNRCVQCVCATFQPVRRELH